MNSLAKNSYLEQTGDNTIILESLEFGFPNWQLEAIRNDWEDGVDLELIAKKQRRKPEEVFLAIFHLGMRGRIKRKFGARYI